MPTPGKRWYHIIISTHGSWLPGDPRGFRSRKHKTHSSGDYKNPPPKGEHAALHDYAQQRAAKAVTIKPDLRPVIGSTILAKAREQNLTTLALSVGSNHAHILAELPDQREEVKITVGTWKQAASHKVRKELLGNVWARGGNPIPIKDRNHQRSVYEYILRHKHENAWVWSFKDE